ncbi:glycosyl hydrolase [Salipiger abyssi]|uniref:glycosyl hydrolase n=1 Tax=Salipiger abyssi TaxID=1250539 RepID=UPI0040591753
MIHDHALFRVLRRALAPALAIVLSMQGATAEPVGPALGAASNLSQGRAKNDIGLARALGVTDFRDGMAWARAEKRPGQYRFDEARTRFPEEIAQAGAHVSVVLNWGNPIFDGGNTPTSPEAVAAFGAFAAELITRFPVIDSLEIGNEFNGVNFVRGPIKQMTPLERARAYVPLLESAAKAARAARPDIRISGGATHSLPVAYLWEILDAGGAAYMDALAIHPYTTPAEQFTRQIAVLRRHPEAAGLPIEITEFAHADPARAAGHFLRNYCQFALGGVSRAVWYPMNLRGEKHVPLYTPLGRITPAGRAFRLIAEHMEGQPVADAAPDDPFAYGCRFGDSVLVLWGAPREVVPDEGVTVLDAEGNTVTGPLGLSETEPLVFVAAQGGIDNRVTMGKSALIADSYHQFAYPEGDEALAKGDGFARFARRGNRDISLHTLPGQEARGTPWFPYRGNPDFGPIRLTAEMLLPGGRGDSPVDIVHRYTAPEDQTVSLSARFAVTDRSDDGIAVTITKNGAPLFENIGKTPIEADLVDLALSAGDHLDIAVGPNGNRKGDLTEYRIRLTRP